MPAYLDVSEPDDPRVADYMGLRTRGERADPYFIAESPHVVRTVVNAGCSVRSVLLTPSVAATMADVVDSVRAPVYLAPREVLETVVGFDLHRGALASVERWELPPVAPLLDGARRIAVLERVNDHENLGVLFRNAAAFGVDAVVLDAQCADPLYRRSVRVSIGHVCTVPWTRYASLDDVRAAGFTLVALTPAVDAVPIGEVEWPVRCALMLGAEGPGLSGAALAAADLRARIPMRAGVDSLNVATAAAIAFHRSV